MNTSAIKGKLFIFHYPATREKSYAGRIQAYYKPSLVVDAATSVRDIDKATMTIRMGGEDVRKRKATIVHHGNVLREDYPIERIKQDMLLGEYTDNR